MKTAPGFQVKLVAHEPQIRQPILVKFDERGRLWVIQYLQYPNPAGLKRVSVDRYSRTTYDRVPEPPPRGPKGEDRITIVEDTDGDGRADRFRDFLTGMNLVTGLEFGHGGVFVLQAPYLLFYPDRNRDDVPDADPEVLLTGFGMEDSQSMANHLTWGPDGWLYGLNGSTTTCRIRGVEFQQGVWRYHPLTKQFELFSEGGGNIYGLTFDANGNLFYSSNGSSLFWHGVQGGYYKKSFGKHGPLHNPYAYGYFDHVKHNGVPGGHIVLGGTMYSGESFPSRYRDTFLGANFLGHSAAWWTLKALGSTVEAKLEGLLWEANDTWSYPTDLAQAPDGSIYLCDFYDVRSAHPDPDADWDKSNGRVYRLEAEGTKPIAAFDLEKQSSRELVQHLKGRNGWFADRARVILAARRDRSVNAELAAMASRTDNGPAALQGLWGLYVNGGFTADIAARLLRHPYEYMRAWTVRLLGDERKAPPLLVSMAASEKSVVVRAQIASTAKRLKGPEAIAILRGLWQDPQDDRDPFLPWLKWWALEDKAVPYLDQVMAAAPQMPPADRQRLMRRYAAEGSARTYDACVKLLASPDTQLLAALNQGLAERGGPVAEQDRGVFERFAQVASAASQERQFAAVTPALKNTIEQLWREKPQEAIRVTLAVRVGVPGAEHAAVQSQQPEMLEAIQEVATAASIPDLLPLLEAGRPDPLRRAALSILARFDDPRITASLVRLHPALSGGLRSQSEDVLLGRQTSALALLEAVEKKQVDASTLALDKLRRVAAYKNPRIDALVRKHWGNIGAGTPEEKLATVRRLSNDLRAAPGDKASGQRLFFQHCGSCHRLNQAGGTLAMDLTAANRTDRMYLLTHTVDPSVFIRKEYMTMEVHTRNGRVVRGLVAEEDAAGITLIGTQYERTRIPRSDVSRMEESAVSLMPEGLLEKLTPQQLRDLFAYLEAK